MIKILIVLLVTIIALGALVTAAIVLRDPKRIREQEQEFRDKKGHHLYYDRSLIEKEEYARRNPYDRGVRTLRRLFFRR